MGEELPHRPSASTQAQAQAVSLKQRRCQAQARSLAQVARYGLVDERDASHPSPLTMLGRVNLAFNGRT